MNRTSSTVVGEERVREAGTAEPQRAEPPSAPQWYRDAVIYQLHVRAFKDGNGDGVGDFAGLTSELDYLKELGVTALWVLPFYPSPLKDDGYDIADYRDIHPAYGSLEDFQRFLREAHARDLRVITELVLNHTSDRHPWFQRSRRAEPESAWRDFYVWSDTPDRYSDARIIFQDFESSNWAWDPVAEAYYWHRFYSHQPDLNFDNPAVREAVSRVMDYWLEMGVDGLRLDAVPYLFEREGTNCENLPETHAFLKELRRRVDENFDDRMLLAEANQWPEDAVAYFGDGDECHMAFNFPVMPRLFMAIRMEDRFPILDILEQTPEIPETCQWAVFLRNHDELTLEMVTDEERDYMYRVYANDRRARINLGIRRRLAPLLGNNRRKIELMNGLLFSLPGTPIIYYGDEIGMGDNIYLGDRNGVRTPMQWSGDRNAGFSSANPQSLYLPVIIDPEYRYEAVNVASQNDNPSSLLWWLKRLISLRRRFTAFGRGELEPLVADNRKVLAFVREHGEERILCVFNLSRFVQGVELEISHLKGMQPTELVGGTRFPVIREEPYFLTLGPHDFYWFSLQPQEAVREERMRIGETGGIRSTLRVSGSWTSLFEREFRSRLDEILPRYMSARRWFGRKAQGILSAESRDLVPFRYGGSMAYLALVEVSFLEGDAQTYLLPLTYATGERAEELLEDAPQAVLCRLIERGGAEQGVLHDAMYEPKFCRAMLSFVRSGGTLRVGSGELSGWQTPEMQEISWERADGEMPDPVPLGGEQSNTSVAFGERFVMKLFRRLEPGVNPDLELSRYLTEREFEHVPAMLGAVEFRRKHGEPLSLAILQEFVPNEGDAWTYTLDVLGRYYERVLVTHDEPPHAEGSARELLAATDEEPSRVARELVGVYLESARTLGERTAQLHTALASAPPRSEFAPEPFSELYQRSLYQSLRNTANQSFRLLTARRDELSEDHRRHASRVLEVRRDIMGRLRGVADEKISASRIRVHGDYHLGQVLYTGKDFVIIDFEGEPTRPLSERRLKRSPLRDVAGMLRSFHYAAYSALFRAEESGRVQEAGGVDLEQWARYWYFCASVSFLQRYLEVARGQWYLPRGRDRVETLLDAFLLEKALYELDYELNNRPDWVGIPLRGLLDLHGSAPEPVE